MIAVHCLLLYSTKPEAKGLGGRLVMFLGGAPAAPTFLFLMGLLTQLKPSPLGWPLVKRALGLVALGYALNFGRLTLPALLGAPLRSDPWLGFWMIDVLQSAGPALLILALTQRLPWIAQLGLAVFVALLAPYLSGLTPFPDVFSFVWGRHELVFFPLLPWLAYPLFGQAFGSLEILGRNLGRALVSLALVGIGLLLTSYLPTDGERFTYYHSSPAQTFWMMGFTGLWLLAAGLVPVRELWWRPLKFLSRNVTATYVISWLTIAWGTFLLGFRQWGMAATTAFIFTQILLVSALTYAWANRGQWRRT